MTGGAARASRCAATWGASVHSIVVGAEKEDILSLGAAAPKPRLRLGLARCARTS